MTAYLLHLRSNIAIRNIQDAFDEFEQVFMPDKHYVVSCEGYTANYVVVPHCPLDQFHKYITEHASEAFNLEHVSLVEIGRMRQVLEQGYGENSDEAEKCGEWRWVKNEESFQYEEIRVRTGLDAWLSKHARSGVDHRPQASGLLLYFHSKQQTDSRWLTKLKSALGPSARVHMPDERSVLLTWSGMNPHELFRNGRMRPYLDAPFVHTAFAFTLGPYQKHTYGQFQSVMPPLFRSKDQTGMVSYREPQLAIVTKRKDGRDPRAVQAAVERLKAAKRRP